MRWVVLVLGLFMLAALGACAEDEPDGEVEPPETADETDPEDEEVADAPLEELTVGLSVTTINYLPLYVADSEGLFEQHGLDVELVTFGSGGDNLRAVVGGQVDVAAGGISGVLNAMAEGQDVKMFWGLHEAAIYEIWGDPEIGSPAELAGRRVAISGLGSLTHQITAFMLREAGVDADDVQWIEAGGAGERVAATVGGSAEAAILIPPATFMAEDEGLVRIQTMSDHVDSWQQEILFARSDVIENENDTLSAFIAAIQDAIELIDSDDELAIATAVEYVGYDREESEAAWEIYRGTWPHDGSPSVVGVETSAQWQVDQGDVDEPFTLDEILDARYIEAAGGTVE